MCDDSVRLVDFPSTISTSQNKTTSDDRWVFTQMLTVRWHCLFALFSTFSVILLCWVLYANSVDDYVFEFKNDSINVSDDSDSAFPIKPVILMWTPVFRQNSLKLGPDCPFFDQCLVTYERRALAHANAVVYHIPDIKWTAPPTASSPRDNHSADRPDLPDQMSLPADALNVFLSQENPSTLKHYYHSEKLEKAIGNFFHSTMTYLRSSDFPMPYGGFWVPPQETLRLGFTFSPVHLTTDRAAILKDKKIKGVVWFVSNCHTKSKRELAVKALSQHMLVNIGGSCATTEQGKKLCPRSEPSCDHVFAAHYFFIAAENDICGEYITEKYWNRYHLPVVPIVMRKRIYEGIVPDHSYIAMDQFESPKAMANHLTFLMDNPDEYLKYFQWRAQNWSVAPWNHHRFLIAHCALCAHLLNNQNQSNPAKPFAPLNAIEWFERNSRCEGGEFATQWSNGK